MVQCIESKTCEDCGEEKPIEDFYPPSVRKGQRRCKACIIAATRRWQKTNHARHQSHQRKYKEKIRNGRSE